MKRLKVQFIRLFLLFSIVLSYNLFAIEKIKNNSTKSSAKSAPHIFIEGIPSDGLFGYLDSTPKDYLLSKHSFSIDFPLVEVNGEILTSYGLFQIYDQYDPFIITSSSPNIANITLIDDTDSGIYEYRVELLSEGQATIHFSLPETDKFLASSFSFTVTVKSGYIPFGFEDTEDVQADLTTLPFINKALGGIGITTYASSKPQVASVDRYSGKVTINAVGETIISASNTPQGMRGSDLWNNSFASFQWATYTLKVDGPVYTAPSLALWENEFKQTLELTNTSKQVNYTLTDSSICQYEKLDECGIIETGLIQDEAIELNTTNTLQTLWLKDEANINKPIDLTLNKFTSRQYHGLTTFNDRLWLIGGSVQVYIDNGYSLNTEPSNDVWSSVDGTNWKLETANAGFPPQTFGKIFTFNQRLWLFDIETLGQITVWSSVDGRDWQQVSQIETPECINAVFPKVHNGQIFIFTGESSCQGKHTYWTSQDTVIWQQKQISTAFDYLAPVSFKGRFLQISNYKVWTSLDGANWQLKGESLLPEIERYAGLRKPPTLTVHNKRLWFRNVDLGYDGWFPNEEVWSSDDGINWQAEWRENSSEEFMGLGEFYSFDNKLWLIAPDFSWELWSSLTNTSLYSEDGRHWSHTSFASCDLRSDYYNSTYSNYFRPTCKFVSSSDKVWYLERDHLYRSVDMLNWQLVADNLPTKNSNSLTLFKEKLWLFESGSTWASSDGINWQLMSEGETYGKPPFGREETQSFFVTTLGDELFIITKKGTTEVGLWRSTDGITWRFTALGRTDPLTNVVASHDNKLWSLNDNVISYSTNGIKWQDTSDFPEQLSIVSFQPLQDKLLVVTYGSPGNSEESSTFNTYYFNDKNQWELLSQDITFSGRLESDYLIEFGEYLYATSGIDTKSLTTRNLWRTTDTIRWDEGRTTPLHFDYHNLDIDNDGILNTDDVDDDNDGVEDEQDAFPLDASESQDSDSDGIGDNADTDNDNDGFTDEMEITLGSDPLDENSIPQAKRGDQNGDLKADILWRNKTTGENYLWNMDGLTRIEKSPVKKVRLDWKVVGRGDFDGDNQSDILWRQTGTGENYLWLMDNEVNRIRQPLKRVSDTQWQVEATTDFNQDGKADILWHHQATGEVYAWAMNSFEYLQGYSLPTVTDTRWNIQGTGDFNGDGHTDIMWRHKAGNVYVWLMENMKVVSRYSIGIVSDNNWKIEGIGDLNGDGTSDLIWRNGNDGRNWAWLIENGLKSVSQQINTVADTQWLMSMVADFNGDGKSDLLWHHQSSGKTYMYLMNGAVIVDKGFLDSVNNNWKMIK